jgi:hypothetical protein
MPQMLIAEGMGKTDHRSNVKGGRFKNQQCTMLALVGPTRARR